MSKRLILVLALALVCGLTMSAYAEVQNVKVSGDLTIMGVARNNFDLTKSGIINSAAAPYDDSERDMLSITRLRVDADLTDNVAVCVRLLNERNWNGETTTGVSANRNIGLNGTPATSFDEQQVDLDLAYVTLKEFLYSPLTMRVGRQELHFNNDFLVGNPGTNVASLRSALAEGDLSARKSFDAVRATLDYNPLVLDIIYAKIAEKDVMLNDDTTLSGINAAYELNKATNLEGFFYSKIRGADDVAVTNVDADGAVGFVNSGNPTSKDVADTVFTVGARAVNKSIKNLTLDLLGAFQFGNYNPKFDPNARFVTVTNRMETSPRRAWAIEAMATYDLKDCKKIGKYNPAITGVYVYLSGSDRDQVGKGTYKGWDPMFENQTFGHIINAIMGFSNVHLTGLSTSFVPVEDVSVKFDAVGAWFAKRYPENSRVILSGVPTARQFTMHKNPFVGQEYDVTLTYDYTEDVQFSLLGGVFVNGQSINGSEVSNINSSASASEVIGSMKVTF